MWNSREKNVCFRLGLKNCRPTFTEAGNRKKIDYEEKPYAHQVSNCPQNCNKLFLKNPTQMFKWYQMVRYFGMCIHIIKHQHKI